MKRGALAAALLGMAAVAPAQQSSELVVFAAGSLRAALTDVARAFEQAEPGRRVTLSFGASGLLKDRLGAGERADVFASANMEHPAALAADGRATPVRRFARNALCALAAPGLDVSAETLVERMLDPAVKLGTSTPKADPSGDYAWQMFERIDRQGRPGAYAQLTGKALQLTGGPDSPRPPEGRNVYGALVAAGQADLFITYCTNASVAIGEQPRLRSLTVPDAINVGADYGVVTLQGASPLAAGFVDFLLGPTGQALLAKRGFLPG